MNGKREHIEWVIDVKGKGKVFHLAVSKGGSPVKSVNGRMSWRVSKHHAGNGDVLGLIEAGIKQGFDVFITPEAQAMMETKAGNV